MGGPREMRIHVQRVIAIPAPHNMPPPPENMGPFAPPPPPPPQGHDQNEVSITWGSYPNTYMCTSFTSPL